MLTRADSLGGVLCVGAGGEDPWRGLCKVRYD